VVRALTPLEIVTKIHRIYDGTHLSMEQVEMARSRVIEVEPVDSAARVPLELDGETPGYLPARFEILPGALTLRC
jgi:diacylglycerol kinase (ATP)